MTDAVYSSSHIKITLFIFKENYYIHVLHRFKSDRLEIFKAIKIISFTQIISQKLSE